MNTLHQIRLFKRCQDSHSCNTGALRQEKQSGKDKHGAGGASLENYPRNPPAFPHKRSDVGHEIAVSEQRALGFFCHAGGIEQRSHVVRINLDVNGGGQLLPLFYKDSLRKLNEVPSRDPYSPH
jgi:hypothetical protein